MLARRAFRMTLDPVVGSLSIRQIPREQPVKRELLFIGQASRDALEQSGLRPGVDLFSQPVERRERRQLDIARDQLVDRRVDDVHRLVHRQRRRMRCPCRDRVRVGAVIRFHVEPGANRRVMPEQRGGGLGVVAELHGVADIGGCPNVFNDAGRNGIERREIVQLLKDLQQHHPRTHRVPALPRGPGTSGTANLLHATARRARMGTPVNARRATSTGPLRRHSRMRFSIRAICSSSARSRESWSCRLSASMGGNWSASDASAPLAASIDVRRPCGRTTPNS
ncbi:hypothetical protein OKW34_004141 [Paraburkholderia youngii]